MGKVLKLDTRAETRVCCKLWHSAPARISRAIGNFFYRLGINIAKNPFKWLIACSVIIILSLLGMLRFWVEKNPAKQWIPQDSDFAKDTEWLMSHYEEGVRIETFILTANNVLEQKTLIKLNEMTKQVISAETPDKISWTDVCMKIPVIANLVHRTKRQNSPKVEDNFFDDDDVITRINKTMFEPAVHTDTKLYCDILNSLSKTCLTFSILDIWDFDSAKIEKDSMEEIIEKINTVKISPTLGHPVNFSDFLGGITLDERGRIIAARAVKTELIVYLNFRDVDMDKVGNMAGTAEWATEDVIKWELAFLNVIEDLSNQLQSEKNENSLKLYYEASRSYGDLSQMNLFQDIDKLLVGIIMMFLYILMILSGRNWVELRFFLTIAGLSCVAIAFITGIGICSMFGVFYGPIHTALPFLLLGLGVDDIFVIMASWKQLHIDEAHLQKPIAERIGLMLSHAGSTITVTSLTDVMAFIVASTTELPSLRSFCIYAAVGIMMTYLLTITVYICCFTLDVRRIEEKKNGMLPCIVHENFRFGTSDPRNTFSWKFINVLYSRLILTAPGKVLVLLLTVAAMSIGIMGAFQLQHWFDPMLLLPSNSYMDKYVAVKTREFPDEGYNAIVVIGSDIDYPSEFPKIISLTERLSNTSIIKSISPWPIDFANFVSMFHDIDLKTTMIADKDFHDYLSKFLISQNGGKYQRNFIFNETFICGKSAPGIVGMTIEFKLKRFAGPHEWIPAMDNSKRIISEAQISGYTTVWSKIYGAWLTDKIIAQEVKRNLFLAMVCVMSTTVVLVVELQTCFWILFCVLLTLLDVCGFMYFWGLSIDLVSCIGLQLAVGLSVDYAAHVAHAFLNTKSWENDKNTRRVRALIAVRHIGAAVAHGAGSSWLAMSMLSFSKNYVYITFFKVFFMVILFGIWHGLIFLPVVLSTIGPPSLHVMLQPQSQPMSEKVVSTDDEN